MYFKARPVDTALVKQIREEMSRRKIGPTAAARLIGLPGPTFNSIIYGETKSLAPKTFEKISVFLGGQGSSSEAPASEISPQFPLPEITGNEQPKIEKEELQALITTFIVGANVLIPAMTVLANGDVGSRKVFDRRGRKLLDALYILSRALSSETALELVRKELGKTTLP